MVNKEFKHYVLSKHGDVVYKMVSLGRLEFAQHVLGDRAFTSSAVCNVLNITDVELQNLYELKDDIDLLWFKEPDVVDEARRIAHAYVQRRLRLKRRIDSMLHSGKPCFFLTLTFTDESLKLSPVVRRKYVAQYLKAISIDYVGNIDFGEELSREHYHAVVVWNGQPLRPIELEWKGKKYSSWGYGFLGAELCGTSSVDSTRLSKYVAKLTNHAFKESALGSSMIYARSTKK